MQLRRKRGTGGNKINKSESFLLYSRAPAAVWLSDQQRESTTQLQGKPEQTCVCKGRQKSVLQPWNAMHSEYNINFFNVYFLNHRDQEKLTLIIQQIQTGQVMVTLTGHELNCCLLSEG